MHASPYPIGPNPNVCARVLRRINRKSDKVNKPSMLPWRWQRDSVVQPSHEVDEDQTLAQCKAYPAVAWFQICCQDLKDGVNVLVTPRVLGRIVSELNTALW